MRDGVDDDATRPERGAARRRSAAATERDADGDRIGSSGRLGRFELGAELRRGASGPVHAGRDPILDRRVAIAVIRAEPEDRERTARVMRAAQAMARLDHPNVVTVHECSVEGSTVYVVMEQAAGTPLAAWLATRRPWRDAAAVAAQVGRGVAAIRAAGIEYRFAPDDVIVTRGGVAKVGVLGPSGGAADADAAGSAAADAADAEAAAAAAADAAAAAAADDQTALATVLRGAVTTGDDGAVPRRLRSILARATAADPTDRYPSLDALAAALERARHRPRGLIGAAAIATAAVIAAGITASTLGSTATPTCAATDRRLDGVWDAAVRDRLRARLIALDPAQGATRFAAAAATLDDRAARWRAIAGTACRANRIARTEPDSVYDARMRCLERRRDELEAAAAGLARAHDAASIDQAVETAHGVADLSACTDAAALAAAIPPPDDPAVRREVDAIEAEVGAINAERFGGTDDHLTARIAALETRARATHYPPILATVLRERADVALDADTPEASIAPLRELTEVAALAHDDWLASWAWSKLLVTLAGYEGNTADAVALLPAARAALSRAPDDVMLRVIALSAEAHVLGAAHDLDAAQARIREAELRLAGTGLLAPQSSRASWFANLIYLSGTLYGIAGQYDASVVELRRAIDYERSAFGPDHVRIAFTWHNLGEALRLEGKTADSIAALEEAVRIRELRVPGSVALADSLSSLGSSLYVAGRLDDADAALDRALAILRAAGSNDIYIALMTRAGVLDDRGKPAEARAAYDEAIASFERAGIRNPNLPMALFDRGDLAERDGRDDDAIADYRRSIELLTEYVGADHPQLGQPLVGLGRELVRHGHPAEALEPLDRALAITAPDDDPPLVAEAQFYRGLALADSGRDRAGGTRTARAALATLAALGADADAALAMARRAWRDRR